MTKCLIFLCLIFNLTTSKVYAQTNHKVGVFSHLNTKQHNSIGLGLQYQWQFSPSFAFESQYSTSGDIKVSTNSKTSIGDQSLLSIGGLFLKAYNPELLIKFSSGINYVINSSDDKFIKQSTISPYFKLGLEYQLSEHLSLETGQVSRFQSDYLGNNFSFYFGVNYLFSGNKELINYTAKSSPNRILSTIVKTSDNEHKPAKTFSSNDNAAVNNAKPSWVIQLGAYTDEFNADQALITFKLNKLFEHYRVVFFNNYFRVISAKYDSYSSASFDSKSNQLNHGIPSLIKQLD